MRRQLVALTGTLASLVAIGLVVVVQVVLAGAATDAVTRVLDDRADALIASAQESTVDTELTVPASRLEPGVAVYDATGARVAGTVPPSLREQFDRLATSTDEALVDVRDSYGVLARPFTTSAGTRGVVVLSEPLAPYENDERDALVVSVLSGVLMVLLAIGLAAWISRRALSPVQMMARTAREWSEHDLDRRFDLGPPTDEIRALGHTLDGLLQKVAVAIQAEQRLTSELAHELRSPLTAISATAELVAMRTDLDDQLREDVDDIQEACRAMAATMTVLLEIARRQGAGEPGATATGAALVDALTARYAGTPALEVEIPADLSVHVPNEVVLRALAPVVDNALRVATHVRVTARPAERQIELVVQDDGPGIDPRLTNTLFLPGSSTGGSGLGLALARRVARSAGGDVVYVAHESSATPTRAGATFVVRLPGTLSPDRHQ